MDFLKGRRFRQTLLCHAGTKLDDEPRLDNLQRFSVSSQLRPETTPVDCFSREAAVFLGTEGRSIKTEIPLMKAALLRSVKHGPTRFAFMIFSPRLAHCLDRVAVQDGEEMLHDGRVLAASLLRAYACTAVEFHVWSPRFVSQPSERPIASPLARVQACEKKKVMNLRHEDIAVEGGFEGIFSNCWTAAVIARHSLTTSLRWSIWETSLYRRTVNRSLTSKSLDKQSRQSWKKNSSRLARIFARCLTRTPTEEQCQT